MFTCCPQCSTVFRVTANQLRAARGDVRCGNCAHVFNAMESLADELPRLDQEDAASNVTPESTSREDSLEFDVPEQAWGEIFIEAPQKPGDIPLDGELEAITANPDEWRSMLAELGVEPSDIAPETETDDAGIAVAAASLVADEDADDDAFADAAEDGALIPEPVYVISDTGQAASDDQARAGETETPVPEQSAPEADEAADPPASGEASSTATGEPVTDDAPVFASETASGAELAPWDELEPVAAETPAKRPASAWALAAFSLAAILALQLVHQARDNLATHPRYGALVRNTYARLGQRLYPNWSLDAFYIRRSEALAGGSAPNALDISAALEVTGAQPVGLPLVRVTLRDQWANTVGRRVFLPEEYLAAELGDIVPPGARIPVTLSLADPGTAARGYEVDLCLQRRHSGLECQLAERPYRP